MSFFLHHLHFLLFRKNKIKKKLRVGFNKTFTFRVDIYEDWKSYKTREYRIQTKKKNWIPYSSSKVKYMQRTITRIRSICHPFGNSHKDFVEPLNTIDQKWLCIYLLFFSFSCIEIGEIVIFSRLVRFFFYLLQFLIL